jgi:O-antigen/teichoic acid export membrane protein
MATMGEAATMSEDDRTANVARGGALTAVGSALSMVLNFGIIIVVTRRYGADGAGVFFSVLALFTIAGTAAKLGAETGLVYSLSRFLARGSDEDVVPTIRLALLPAIVVALLLGAAATAWSMPIAEWLSDAASSEQFALVVRNIALVLPAYVAVHILSGATRGLGMMRPTVYGISVGRPALQLVPMAAVAGAGLGLGALGLAWAIPLGLTAIVMYWWLNHALNERGIPRVVLHPRPGLSREFWSYAAPRGFANTLSTAQDRVGVLVVSAMATAATAGVFVTVARLIGALQLFTYAIGQALNPQLSALISHGDDDGAQRLLQQVSAWTAMPVLPVAAGLMLFPEVALSVFGSGFESGAATLSLLAGTVVVTAILGHADNVLLMGGRSRTSLLDVIAALVVTFGGLMLLVPDHGLFGAGVAWSLGMLTYALLPLWQGWRQMGLHPFGPESANVLLALVPMLVIGASVRVAVGDTPLGAGVGIGAGLGAYAATIWSRRWEIGLLELADVFKAGRGAA